MTQGLWSYKLTSDWKRLSFSGALTKITDTFLYIKHTRHSMILQVSPSPTLESIPHPPNFRSMDRFLAPSTPEALAHSHFTENFFYWDLEHPSMDETLLAGCASYQAFNRYLGGTDLFLLPRSRSELESVLRRYSYDAIHNAIAKSRSTLERGGYSRACALAEKSIQGVLDTGDNVETLLTLHLCPTEADLPDLQMSPPSIKSN